MKRSLRSLKPLGAALIAVVGALLAAQDVSACSVEASSRPCCSTRLTDACCCREAPASPTPSTPDAHADRTHSIPMAASECAAPVSCECRATPAEVPADAPRSGLRWQVDDRGLDLTETPFPPFTADDRRPAVPLDSRPASEGLPVFLLTARLLI